MATTPEPSPDPSSVSRLLQKLPKGVNLTAKRVIHQGVLLSEDNNKNACPRWGILYEDVLEICKPAEGFENEMTTDCCLRNPDNLFRHKCKIELSSTIIDERQNALHSSRFIVDNFSERRPFALRSGHDVRIFCGRNADASAAWVQQIHAALVAFHIAHVSMNTERYGWIHELRLGTLHSAVLQQDVPLISRLLEMSPNLQQTDLNGSSVAHIACSVDNTRVLRLCTDEYDSFGVTLNVKDGKGLSPLRIAADNNSVNCVDFLLSHHVSGVDLGEKWLLPGEYEHKTASERTILHEMVSRNNVEMVVTWITAAPRRHGGDTEVRRLRRRGVNLDSRDGNGCTVLHEACQIGSEALVRLLIEQGCNVNASDHQGNRPLHLVRPMGQNCLRWLLAYGAQPDLVNTAGDLPRALSLIPDDQISGLRNIFTTVVTYEIARRQPHAPDKETAWFEDKMSDACLLCNRPFTRFFRRHHCRKCGVLVCGNCSDKKLEFETGPDTGAYKLERACDMCVNQSVACCMIPRPLDPKNGSYIYMQPRDIVGHHIATVTNDEALKLECVSVGGREGSATPPSTGPPQLTKRKSEKNLPPPPERGRGGSVHRHTKSAPTNALHQNVASAQERVERMSEMADKTEEIKHESAKSVGLSFQVLEKLRGGR